MGAAHGAGAPPVGDVPFADRDEAGRRLADALLSLDWGSSGRPVVLGMARGGVAVAAPVAAAMETPLDVLVVRKVGYPAQPELALGAIGEGGVRVRNDALVARLGLSGEAVDELSRREELELERRLAVYRGGRAGVDLTGRTAVVVDDGVATGATARAALLTVRRRGAARVVLGVPVAPPAALAVVGRVADDVVCVEVSERFSGLSQWYGDFDQVTDDEVCRLLAAARR